MPKNQQCIHTPSQDAFQRMQRLWADSVLNFAAYKGRNCIDRRSSPLLQQLNQLTQHRPDVGAMIMKGERVTFFGDPHFGHANIIKHCQRPFATAEIMDEMLQSNISQDMEEGTALQLCLGDLSMRDSLLLQKRRWKQYGSRQILLLGNHDHHMAVDMSQWLALGTLATLAFALPKQLLLTWAEADWDTESIAQVDWKKLPDNLYFGCAHWPLPAIMLPGPDWVSIHGHTHNNHAHFPCCINVSVEVIHYQPQTLRALISPTLLAEVIDRQKQPKKFTLDNFLGLEH